MSNNHVEPERIDANSVSLNTPSGLDITLFANEQVAVDRATLNEVGTLSCIEQDIERLNAAGFFGDYPAGIVRAVLTPDVHKGAGLCVGSVVDASGFVLPKCPGTDIGCGMRLIITDMTAEDFEKIGTGLDDILRRAFFGGQRDIAFDEQGREAILRDGIVGLRPPAGATGLWRHIDIQQVQTDMLRTHRAGRWSTTGIWDFADYVRGSGGTSHDSAIGSIGGGNHFIELQRVDELLDRRTCWQWGIRHNAVAIMVHTGSVGIGGTVGNTFVDKAKALHPKGMAMPQHGFHPIPTVGPHADTGAQFLNAMGLAVNFASVNRLMLGALTLRCLSEAAGRTISGSLVHDSPHNAIWSEGHRHLHRKGACPAELNPEDPVFPDGHPVIIPGSMGSASYVLKGQGCVASLCSAPHGAGRLAARGEGRKANPAEMQHLRVVTKIDLKRVRRDIAEEYSRTLMEEAPSQYKDVTPVIDTVSAAGIAQPVARMMPLLTIKG